jgi:hypothetical protein
MEEGGTNEVTVEETKAEETNASESEAELSINEEDIAEWENTTKLSVLTILVNDPITDKSFRPVTTYAVNSTCPGNETLNTTVRRRYSEFEYLYLLLTKRYVGLILPSLPEKKLMGKTKRFVTLRMNALTRWFNRLIENPYLKSDPTMQEFLSCQADGKEWDALKKAWMEDAEANYLDRPHIRRWRAKVDSLTLPDTYESIISNAYDKYTHQFAALSSKCLSAAATAETRTKNQAGAISNFYKSLFSCGDICNEAAKKEGVSDETNAEAVGSIQAVAECWLLLSDCFEGIACITNGASQRVYSDILQVLVKEYAGAYQSAIKVIDNIKTLQQTIQTTESNIQSTEATLEALRETKGEQDPKVEATVLLIKHGKSALESLRAEIVALRKALVMEQLYQFGENMSKDMNVLMIKVSAIHAAVAHERARKWNFLATKVAKSTTIVGKRAENTDFKEKRDILKKSRTISITAGLPKV